jgi:hypothetical protein
VAQVSATADIPLGAGPFARVVRVTHLPEARRIAIALIAVTTGETRSAVYLPDGAVGQLIAALGRLEGSISSGHPPRRDRRPAAAIARHPDQLKMENLR